MLLVASRLAAVGALIWALSAHPYDYYVILRFLVCLVSGISAHKFYLTGRSFWAWALGINALVYNPFLPLHLHRPTWEVINIISAGLLLVSIFCDSRGVPEAAKAQPEADITEHS